MERLGKDTKCPECKNELDDKDGVFFDKWADKKECPYCNLEIQYVKQFKRDIGNPYCDYVWEETYIKWERG